MFAFGRDFWLQPTESLNSIQLEKASRHRNRSTEFHDERFLCISEIIRRINSIILCSRSAFFVDSAQWRVRLPLQATPRRTVPDRGERQLSAENMSNDSRIVRREQASNSEWLV